MLVGLGLSGCFASSDTTATPVASATPTFVPGTATSAPASTATIEPTSPTQPATPGVTPENPRATPTALPTPAPAGEEGAWWVAGQTTWNDTFELTLEIFGLATITRQSELRARTTLRNVSDGESRHVRWSQYDPHVATWLAKPSPPQTDTGLRAAVVLIPLTSPDDPTPTQEQFSAIQTETLEAGDVIEREASWDLTVRGEGAGARVAAPDGEYELRIEFYPHDGNRFPGMPDVKLEFPIILARGVSG